MSCVVCTLLNRCLLASKFNLLEAGPYKENRGPGENNAENTGLR